MSVFVETLQRQQHASAQRLRSDADATDAPDDSSGSRALRHHDSGFTPRVLMLLREQGASAPRLRVHAEGADAAEDSSGSNAPRHHDSLSGTNCFGPLMFSGGAEMKEKMSHWTERFHLHG